MRFAHLLSFFFLTQWTAYAMSDNAQFVVGMAVITGTVISLGIGAHYLKKYNLNHEGQKKFIESGIDLKEVERKLEFKTQEDRKKWAKFKSGVLKKLSMGKEGKTSEGKKSKGGTTGTTSETPKKDTKSDGTAGVTTKDSPPTNLLREASDAVSQPPASKKGKPMKYDGEVEGSPSKTLKSGESSTRTSIFREALI